MKKRFVQFGAGNIGRSFIAQIFAALDYDVVFIDINQTLIDELNRRGSYDVIIKNNNGIDETIHVTGVRGINGNDKEACITELIQADIAATSVGKNALRFIFPVIAEALTGRQSDAKAPLDIIIAENIRGGAEYFKNELSRYMPATVNAKKCAGLIETSIGKMVPIMKEEDLKKDPLWVFAEPYNNLILDKHGFKNEIPPSKNIKAVDNITAYVDRKLFIHNLGHAATAYLSYQKNPETVYIYEALKDREIHEKVRGAMSESAAALLEAYPDAFDQKSLDDHIDDLLFRFQNKSLGDTVFRVGKDLMRKLHKTDRVVGAMLLAEKYNVPYGTIQEIFSAAVKFRAADENGNLFPGDRDFTDQYTDASLETILSDVCALGKNDPVESRVKETLLQN